MVVTPTQIQRQEGHGLTIRWSDGSTSDIPSAALRKACPCAVCREARGEGSHDAPLTPQPGKKKSLMIVQNSLSEELDLKEIWSVGNYALGLRWGDGHDTGIYTYEQLRTI